MKRMMGVLGVAAVGLLVGSSVWAQSKTITGDMVTVKGTIEAIDHDLRVLTLKDEKGALKTVDIPRSAQRFSELKIGDTVTIKYYENVVIRLKPEGEPDVDTAGGALTPGEGQRPGGTAAVQRTITAKIEAIDMSVPSITFTGPSGWKYSRRVEDKANLANVKVGDRVDMTWTEAVVLDVEAKK
jgi:hypothetical protein